MTKIKNSEKHTSEVDVIGDILDNCRYWQLRTIFFIYLTRIPVAFFMACIIYTAPIPKRAHVFCSDVSVRSEQGPLSSFTAIIHPPVVSVNDKEFDLSYCDTFADIKEHVRLYYENNKNEMSWITHNISRTEIYNLTMIPCKVFDFESNESVTTYDIVCSRGSLVILTQGMHLVGIVLSGVVIRHSTKVVGPLNIMRVGLILQIISGNIAGLTKSFIVHLLFRALAATGCATAFGSGAIIFSDITRGKLKTAAIFFFDIFWSIGIIILSVITQYESRWTELYLIISYPSLIIIILSIWIPDSPRWLLKHGRIKEIETILREAANSCQSTTNFPANLTYILKSQANKFLQEPPPARWLNLWEESVVTNFRLVAVHIAFACFTITYFGMVLYMSNFGRNNLPKTTIFIVMSEIIGCIMGCLLAITTKQKFRWSGILNIFGATIAFCIWFWSNRESDFVQNGILLYFCLVLKVSASCSFGILRACTTDLVRMDKKPILIFSCVLCGRLWSLNAPVFISLGTFYGAYLSLTLFATAGVIGGLAMISIDFTHEITKLKEIGEARNSELQLQGSGESC